MTELIYHIGMPKTGSTAIQNFFHTNRQILAEQGLLYPTTFDTPLNHHALDPYLFGPGQIPAHMIARMGWSVPKAIKRSLSNHRHVLEEILRRNPSMVVFSSESVFRKHAPAGVERIRELIESVSRKAKFIVYIRNPVDHYLSFAYQKLAINNYFLIPQQYTKYFGSIPKRIDFFSEKYPDYPLMVRVYDRKNFPNGDVVADFFDLIGFEALGHYFFPEKDDNVSLSAEALVLFEDYGLRDPRRSRYRWKQQTLVRKLVREADNYIRNSNRPELLPQVAEAMTRSTSALLTLRDHYDIVFDNIDYDLIGKPGGVDLHRIESVSDICAIDPDRLAEMRKYFKSSKLKSSKLGVLRRMVGFFESGRSTRSL